MRGRRRRLRRDVRGSDRRVQARVRIGRVAVRRRAAGILRDAAHLGHLVAQQLELLRARRAIPHDVLRHVLRDVVHAVEIDRDVQASRGGFRIELPAQQALHAFARRAALGARFLLCLVPLRLGHLLPDRRREHLPARRVVHAVDGVEVLRGQLRDVLGFLGRGLVGREREARQREQQRREKDDRPHGGLRMARAACHGGRDCASQSPRRRIGSRTVNVVPWPTTLSTSIVPPWRRTMSQDTERPSPVPTPTGFVV